MEAVTTLIKIFFSLKDCKILSKVCEYILCIGKYEFYQILCSRYIIYLESKIQAFGAHRLKTRDLDGIMDVSKKKRAEKMAKVEFSQDRSINGFPCFLLHRSLVCVVSSGVTNASFLRRVAQVFVRGKGKKHGKEDSFFKVKSCFH